jgi:hypothetical protein
VTLFLGLPQEPVASKAQKKALPLLLKLLLITLLVAQWTKACDKLKSW